MTSAILAVADVARRDSLRLFSRTGLVRYVFADRTRRVYAGFLFSLATASAFGLVAPLFSLWLGAALLGVPHVVASLRFVSRDQRVTPVTKLCAVLGVGVAVAQLLGAGDWTVGAFALLFGASSVAEVIAARGSKLRALGLVCAIGAGAAFGVAQPLLFVVAITHVHAMTSVGYFFARAHRRGIPIWPLVALLAAVVVLALSGALDPLMPHTLLAPRAGGPSVISEASQTVFPGASAMSLRRGLFLYVIGQQLHFAVWLRLLPDVERERPVPTTFRRAFEALRVELGRFAVPALVIAVAGAVYVLVAGSAAREGYFALTYFHLGLEAAVIAGMLARAGVRS